MDVMEDQIHMALTVSIHSKATGIRRLEGYSEVATWTKEAPWLIIHGFRIRWDENQREIHLFRIKVMNPGQQSQAASETLAAF